MILCVYGKVCRSKFQENCCYLMNKIRYSYRHAISLLNFVFEGGGEREEKHARQITENFDLHDKMWIVCAGLRFNCRWA